MSINLRMLKQTEVYRYNNMHKSQTHELSQRSQTPKTTSRMIPLDSGKAKPWGQSRGCKGLLLGRETDCKEVSGSFWGDGQGLYLVHLVHYSCNRS